MTPIPVDEYASFDAVGLAELVRRGDVTPAELLETALEVIASVNPRMNAVVGLEAEDARQALFQGLPKGRFFGVPFLIKDFLERQGCLMTMGSVILRAYRPNSTHEIANRIQAAGLVILGRTNMSELGLLPVTEPALFGPTINPWAVDRSPGGSSGGSAAAVAAGMIPMAHAADGGGSIRIPASACGLFGLKPSRGRNPSGPDDPPEGFVEHHVLSRTVRDSAAFLDVVQGARPSDRWSLPDPQEPYEQAIEKDPPTLRIAFMVSDFSHHAAHEECRTSVMKAARLSEQLGHHVEEARPPVDGEKLSNAFAILWAAPAGYFFKRIQLAVKSGTEINVPWWAGWVVRHRSLMSLAMRVRDPDVGQSLIEPFTRHLAGLESRLTPADLWVASAEMHCATRKMAYFFQEYDALLTPVLGEPPWPIGYLDQSMSVRKFRERLYRYVGYTPIANAGGFPAMSVPGASFPRWRSA